jgi:hypothetical protein
MKISSVSVVLSKKRTVNYQSTGNSIGLTADLDDGEDAHAAVRQLQREAAKLLLKMDGQQQSATIGGRDRSKEEDQ